MTRHPHDTSTAPWTIADIPDQTGRRALITGANSGIGFHAALELARKGAHVVLACRDQAKGAAALTRLLAQVPQAQAEVVLLDLASFASIHTAAQTELARNLPLDLLINNAGVYAPRHRQQTADGFELQFGTNVLGHFLLTALLMPALERAAAKAQPLPRIVMLASIAHKSGALNFADLQSQNSYDPSRAYSQSKLACLMLAFELDRRLRAASPPTSRILSIAAHPGVAATNLFQAGDFHAVERFARRAISAAIGTLLNTEAEGALPTLYAATAPNAISGGYYGPQGLWETRGTTVGPSRIAPQALDTAAAAHLWTTCEDLTATPFL